jgi:hypothetical protein
LASTFKGLFKDMAANMLGTPPPPPLRAILAFQIFFGVVGLRLSLVETMMDGYTYLLVVLVVRLLEVSIALSGFTG